MSAGFHWSKAALWTALVVLMFSGLSTTGRMKLSAKGPQTIYYVDSQRGEDSNPGTTPDKPWKSLDKINSTTFQAGDSILLKADSVWVGQLWPKGSGKDGQPIHVGKYGKGATPQIKGNGQVEDAVLLKNQEYWEIEDLEVSNSGETKATRRGVHLAVENFGEAHHVVVRNLTVHDVSGRDDVKDNGGIIFTSVGDKKPSRFVDVLIENNELYHVDRNGISSWSDRWQRSHWFPSLRVVVRGNKLRDIGGDGIMIAVTDGALIEQNTVGHANQRSEGYNIAIWTWSADNSIIQFNEAYETKGQRDGEGFDSDWNSRNTIFQYNYSHDNDGGFLLICDDGSQGPTDSIGNVGTIVRYNISQNDRHRGITLSGPVRDTLIYNNTIYIGEKQTSDVVLFTDWEMGGRTRQPILTILCLREERRRLARLSHGIKIAAHTLRRRVLAKAKTQSLTLTCILERLLPHKTDIRFLWIPNSMRQERAVWAERPLRDTACRWARQRGPMDGVSRGNGGKDFWGEPLGSTAQTLTEELCRAQNAV